MHAAGGTLPGNVTTTIFHDLNFGNGTNGLAAGTITVSNTAAADSVNFAPGSGAITLTGGTIAANSIVAQNTSNTIGSAITLNPAGTVSFSRNTGVTGILSLNGSISGNADLTFTTPYVNSGNHQQTIVLGTSNSYTGDAEITSGSMWNTVWVQSGVANALPPTTVLLLNGGAGSGTGRTVAYDLNSLNQILAGLTNIAGLNLRNQRVLNSSGTAATQSLSNSAHFTFGGTIGYGGTNLGLTKIGTGTLTLTGTNAYTGVTIVSNGTLLVNNTTGGGTGTGAVTVNGGTLGGAGIISGAVTNNAGGTLTLGGQLVLKAGSTNTFDVNGSTRTNDVIILGASVAYGGVLIIVPTGAFTNGQTFILFRGVGATNAGNFASLAGSSGSGKAFSFTNGMLSVVSTAPPQPPIAPVTVSGTNLVLSVPTISGASYVLQSATNLTPTINWKGESTNAGTGGNLILNVPIEPGKPQKYLRLWVN